MPAWFRIWDLITFGGPGILCAALAAYVQTTDASGEVKACMWATSAVFLAVYAAFVFARYRASRR